MKAQIREIRARGVDVPLGRPIQTGGGLVRTAPLVLIDLETGDGLIGRSYLFCYTTLALGPLEQLVRNLGEALRGQSAAPAELEQKLAKRFRLLGAHGLTGMAMAGIDMAAWDALGKACGLPLVRLLGGEPRPVPAYNSCGLGLIGLERAAAEARELVEPGFGAVKVRLGYPEAETDLAVVEAVRRAVGPQVAIMSDYNQCLSVPEAVRRIRLLEGQGLTWVEEPVLAEDYAGHAAVRRQVKTPIQSGENWWGPGEMSKALAAGASDFVMADAMKIGGVTGWLRAAALAEAAGTPLSSHLYPEFSVHLLAVTPARHWLEYIEFAAPILREPLRVERGMATPPERTGVGLEWDEEAVARLLRC